MSDFDRDELLLSGAFEEFTTGSTPKINAEGTAAVRKRVAHRRKVRAILLVLLTALAIGVPVAVYAMNDRDTPKDPVHSGASVNPTASPRAASEPTVAPSPGPSGISRELLQLSTITIPAWKLDDPALRCQEGAVKLTTATKDGVSGVQILANVVDANLDADPALEAAAILECLAGPGAPRQVVAFERDSAGRIITLGQVMKGYPASLTQRTAAGGGVMVDLLNLVACCDTSHEMELHQQRGYAWNGKAFVQIDGPQSFGPHPHVTDLKISATGLTFGAVTNGKRTGTMKVTVRNVGNIASNRFELKVAGTVTACAGSRCYNPGQGGFPIIDGIAAGKSVTYTVKVVVLATDIVGAEVTVVVTAMGVKDHAYMADLNPTDNTAKAAVTRS